MRTLFDSDSTNVLKQMVARARVIHEAQSWIGTPYHLKGRLKGIGADCFTFIAEVMIACGLFGRDDLPAYQNDWFCHQKDEVYLKLLFKYCRKTLDAVSRKSIDIILPGNIVAMTTWNSKIANHGGIVVEWPRIIHCIYSGVHQVDASVDPMWSHRQIQVFDPWRRP